jgi:hypothetical protein
VAHNVAVVYYVTDELDRGVQPDLSPSPAERKEDAKKNY